MRHQFLTLAIFLREIFCDESLGACGTPEGNLNYEEISLDRSCEKGEFPWSAIVISSETRKFVTFVLNKFWFNENQRWIIERIQVVILIYHQWPFSIDFLRIP